jgi:hypothetical protein
MEQSIVQCSGGARARLKDITHQFFQQTSHPTHESSGTQEQKLSLGTTILHISGMCGDHKTDK